MSGRELGAWAFIWLSLAVVLLGLLVSTGCAAPEEEAEFQIGQSRFIGLEVDGESLRLLADCIDVLPGPPWSRLIRVEVGGPCNSTMTGCYDWERWEIITTRAALCHELGHAAAVALHADPDYDHRAPWWRALDAVLVIGRGLPAYPWRTCFGSRSR